MLCNATYLQILAVHDLEAYIHVTDMDTPAIMISFGS